MQGFDAPVRHSGKMRNIPIAGHGMPSFSSSEAVPPSNDLHADLSSSWQIPQCPFVRYAYQCALDIFRPRCFR
jgi:hypothetical protein